MGHEVGHPVLTNLNLSKGSGQPWSTGEEGPNRMLIEECRRRARTWGRRGQQRWARTCGWHQWDQPSAPPKGMERHRVLTQTPREQRREPPPEGWYPQPPARRCPTSLQCCHSASSELCCCSRPSSDFCHGPRTLDSYYHRSPAENLSTDAVKQAFEDEV